MIALSSGLIGILGVGHLGEILVDGLLRAGVDPARILLAPRGNAGAISRRSGIEVAANNEDLVDRCQTIILAIRVDQALAALSPLPWRRGQILLSACAGISIAALQAQLPEGVQIFRFMPFSSADLGESPTAIFPANDAVRAFMQAFGPVIPLPREADFETASTFASMYGWVHRLIGISADWAIRNGLTEETANQFAAFSTISAGRNVVARDLAVDDLLEHLATPGGITEHGLNHLAQNDIARIWDEALTSVRAKLVSTAQ